MHLITCRSTATRLEAARDRRRCMGIDVRDIDKIIEVLRNAHQNLVIEQLRVTHPGVDDNGIWFFKNPATGIETQLESSTGNCPFLIESNRNSEREYANTIPQAISIVTAVLGF